MGDLWASNNDPSQEQYREDAFMPKNSTVPELDHQKRKRPKVVSVSIPPKKQAEFYEALATLKRHHEDPFIQQAPLIVETIIEAARRIQQEAKSQEEQA